MESYIIITKGVIDHIMVIDDDIFDRDHILYVLRGLYFYSHGITWKDHVPSLDKVFSLLKIHENS